MRLPPAEVSHEAPPPGAGVRHHLQHHGVGGGEERPRPERSAEAAQLLHRVGVAVVNVQVVVATRGVGLQVEEAEGEHDHVALGDLQGLLWGVWGERRGGGERVEAGVWVAKGSGSISVNGIRWVVVFQWPDRKSTRLNSSHL